jgi:hypothetical protein
LPLTDCEVCEVSKRQIKASSKRLPINMQPISTSIALNTGIGDGSFAKVQNILYKAKFLKK